jgi:histidinol-phosphate aminotransferase
VSKFFNNKLSSLSPYVPGEQPKDMRYVKLNTNESPFAPSKKTIKVAKKALNNLNLYSDPEMRALRQTASKLLGVGKDNIVFTNGSDEALNLAFMAYGENGIVFPEITYGFYPVFATLNGIDYKTIALKEDFSVDYRDYLNLNKTIVIANPNAPTGIALPLEKIEQIVKSNNSIVIIDEAYIDFGGESVVGLTEKYDNLLVVQTFSKSRSLAGARLGFAVGNEKLIADINTLRYSTNPYNVNSTTLALGIGAFEDNEYYKKNCQTIINNRQYLTEKLFALGFDVIPSMANFVFAKHGKISGEEIYARLKQKGVLVRHFSIDKIKDFNRITIGTKKQIDILI